MEFANFNLIISYFLNGLFINILLRKKISLFGILFSSFILNSIVLTFLFLKILFSFNFFNIYFLLILSVILSLLLLKPINYEKINKLPLFIDLVSLVLLFINFYIIFPLLNLPVPPLHDGIANSYWGKVFLENNFSNFPKSLGFYQPGGSILVGFYSNFLFLNTAIVNNILTISSLILIPILMSYFITLLFANDVVKKSNSLVKTKIFLFYISIYLFLFFLNKWHLSLFLIGSKNSLLISTPYYALFLICFFSVYLESKNRINDFICLILFFISATLVHYTMFFLSIPFFLLLLIKILKRYKQYIKEEKNKIFIGILFTFLLIIIFFTKTNFFDSLKNLFLAEIISLPNLTFANIYDWLIKRSLNSFGDLLKFIAVFSFIILLKETLSFCLKKNLELPNLYLYSIIYLIFFFIFLLTPLHIVRVFVIEYNFYLVPIFLSSLFAGYVFKNNNIKTLWISFIFWLILLSFYEFKKIKNINIPSIANYILISKKDLRAFKWIEKNLNNKDLFFPLQYSYVGNLTRIFDLSPIAYLKVFTNFSSCPEFIPSENNPQCSEKIIPYLKIYNNDLTNTKLLNILKQENIKYFYYSKQAPWGDGVIDMTKFINSDLFKEIYNNKFVKIYTFK